MKRRVTSVVLALVMILSLLPIGAFAAENGPVLKMHVQFWDNDGQREEPVTEWTQSLDSSWSVRFVLYNADGTCESLEPDMVQLPSFLRLEETEDGWAELHVLAVDTGVVAYQGLTVEISGILPDLGLYSALPASPETLINDPLIDEDNNVFYVALSPAMVNEGFAMTEVHNEFGPEIHSASLTEIGTVELSQDGTYATVTVTDLTADGNYHFEASLTAGQGDNTIWGRSVWINNNMPGLYYSYVDEENDNWIVRTEHPENNLWCVPGNSHFLVFFFGKRDEIAAGKVAPLSFDQLTFPAYMQVEEMADNVRPGTSVPEKAKMVRITRFAEADEGTAIIYEVNGTRYAVSAEPRLPAVGFYTEPVASREAYVYDSNPFLVTETDRTVYICGDDADLVKMDSIVGWHEGNAEALFYVTADADGKYLKLTVKEGEIVPNRGFGCEVEFQRRYNVEEPWNTERNGLWLEMKNNQPALMYRYMDWDNEKECWYEEEDREFNTTLELSSGDSASVRFYYGTEESKVPVDVKDLTFPAGLVKGYDRDGATWVEGIGFEESGVITYTKGNVTAKMKITVTQPDYGFYNSTNASKDTYLSHEVAVDSNIDSFYVVAKEGRPLDRIEGVFANRDEMDAGDWFDIQFGSENGVDYAKFTLKKGDDGKYLAFGQEYVIHIEEDWGIRYVHFELIRNDLPQLTTPFNLIWHIEYGWDWDQEKVYSEDRLGTMSFNAGELTQNRYEIELYSATDNYTEPVLSGGWEFGDMDHSAMFSVSDFIYADLPSGTYKFRVRAEGDGTKYRDSNWSEFSPEFNYVQPQAQLTGVDPNTFEWERWDAMYHSTWERSTQDGAKYYEVRWSYMENGERREHMGSFDMQAWDMENLRMDAGLPDEVLEELGNVDLYFRVRVIPADITQYRVSPWSDYSEALVIQEITDFVNDKLDNLVNQPSEPDQPTSGLTVQDVQDALINDTADLRTAMAADLELSGGTPSGTLERIEELEQTVINNVEEKIEVAPTAPTQIQNIADGITMVGATLNVAAQETEGEETPAVTLKLDQPEEGIVIPEQQHNAVQFSMKLDGAVDKNDVDQAGQLLIVPVVIDMPVPADINPNFLVVLHKLWDGSIEQMRPYIYMNEADGRYHARFVVDSFSDFAFVEYFGFDVETVTKKVGDASFTEIASCVIEGVEITYFSSDPDVAEVDPMTGEVTIKKAGTVTITANASACDIYGEASARYTLIVESATSGGGSSSGGSTTGGSAPIAPAPVPEAKTFEDVAEEAYYFNAVQWAVNNGITSGISETAFGPDNTCTRAQAVTFLWSAAGKPAPKSTEMPFADVAADSYYHNAVLWAVENGITSGTGADTFSPDATCTRAQIITFLWSAAGKPAPKSTEMPFADVAADSYYRSAVLWAVENGITSGISETAFGPDATCTRAQIVTFLWGSMVK